VGDRVSVSQLAQAVSSHRHSPTRGRLIAGDPTLSQGNTLRRASAPSKTGNGWGARGERPRSPRTRPVTTERAGIDRKGNASHAPGA
jgi:hypothetical protein